MTHYQDPRELFWFQPACGEMWSGGAWVDPDSPYITCRACQAIVDKANENTDG